FVDMAQGAGALGKCAAQGGRDVAVYGYEVGAVGLVQCVEYGLQDVGAELGGPVCVRVGRIQETSCHGGYPSERGVTSKWGTRGPSECSAALALVPSVKRNLVLKITARRCVWLCSGTHRRPADGNKYRCDNPADSFLFVHVSAGTEPHDRIFAGVAFPHPVVMLQQVANGAASRRVKGAEGVQFARAGALQYEEHLLLPHIFLL